MTDLQRKILIKMTLRMMILMMISRSNPEKDEQTRQCLERYL